MRRILLVGLAVAFSLTVFACAKKESDEMVEPITMETLNTLSTAPAAPAVANPVAVKTEVAVQAQVVPSITNVPTAVLSIPTAQEIQAALKAAGLYAGEIDGKIGPKSTEAIKAFQQQAGLQADGKVGSKTWAALSKYLTPVPEKKR